MRHYEIVFLVHPDQSEQVPAMLERYRSMIESSGGAIHRHWTRPSKVSMYRWRPESVSTKPCVSVWSEPQKTCSTSLTCLAFGSLRFGADKQGVLTTPTPCLTGMPGGCSIRKESS